MNQDIKNRIITINKPDSVRLFFNLTRQLINRLKLDENNEKLAITIQNDNRDRFTVNLNGRIVLNIKNGEDFGFMVNDVDLVKVEGALTLKRKGKFAEQWNQSSWITVDYAVLHTGLDLLTPLWLKSCADYEPAMQKSPYRRHHIGELYRMAMEPELLEEYIDSAPLLPLKFESIVNDLRDYMKGEENILADFTIHPLEKPIKPFVWIADAEGIIGDMTAHYELRQERANEIAVALHFEGKKSETEVFYKRIRILPENIDWSPWMNAKSLLYTPRTPIDDPDLLKKICEQLLYFEEHLGDIVRGIIRNPGMESNSSTDRTNKYPLNQILFGPPGTGKTYNTLNKALEIIGVDIAKKSRQEMKALYNACLKEGRIVFTTFHQSMSYEDFVEGIKPETIDDKVIYNIKNGIFKNLCQAAITPNQVDFNAAYEQLIKDLSETEMIALKTPTGREYSISLNSNDNLTLHTGPKRDKQGTLTKENIQKQIRGEEKYLGWEGYFKGVINYLESAYQYSSKKSSNKQNFVLIIDEINRGNVSQILGELITLIEEDKRLGNDEALEVTLPYSKENFGVPSNLYIIGTMNTADRSVEALDTALRRRIFFEEMRPDSKLITTKGKVMESKGGQEGGDLRELLDTLNQRIEKLLDKDRLIGHSYFMAVSNLEELKTAFRNKIIPLLQEYFFGDYGKIGLVLGTGFIEPDNQEDDLFAEFEEYDASGFTERIIFRIKEISDMDDPEFRNALNILLRK
ncbi:MAG: AAA family ATPase [Bacteroidota bacterium]